MEDVKEKEDVKDETGAAGAEEKDTTSKGGADDVGKKEEPKTFTQDQVNAMMAKEKKQGKKSALTELGLDGASKSEIAEYLKWKESQKTEEQKASEKSNAETQARIAAEQKAKISEAKVEAMVLGVKPDSVDDIIALAIGKMTDDSDFKTIISELKTKYPTMFNDGGNSEKDNKKDEKKKTGQKGTGGNVKNDVKGKENEEGVKGLGARLAAQRKGAGKKSSYFGNK